MKDIKKNKITRFLALKIWAVAVPKFFDVVLKFELPNARFLDFPKNSVAVLIIRACVYLVNFKERSFIIDAYLKQVLSTYCGIFVKMQYV